MVADREVIAHLRELRRLSVKQPPPNNQRAAAQFLSLGHYDSMMRRIGREFRTRQIALRDALNHYLPRSIAIQPVRWLTTYDVVSKRRPTLDASLATKDRLLKRGVCRF